MIVSGFNQEDTMTPSSKLVTLTTTIAIAVTFVFSASMLRAQESSAAATDPALTSAAQKAFKAIADGDAEAVKPLVEKKYAKHLTNEELRPPQTGPKVAVAYDGNVRVMRADGRSAIVQATMFAPSSNDIPKSEASKLTLFMYKEKGDEWLVGAPDKKQAEDDATITGGWYHPGAFTFCPNKGIEYLGSHFSSKLNCQAAAICR
jgi:hypothetical protein